MPILTITGSLPSKPTTESQCLATYRIKKGPTSDLWLTLIPYCTTPFPLLWAAPLKLDPLLAKTSQVLAIPSFTLIKNNHGISSSFISQPYPFFFFFCLPQLWPLLFFSLSTIAATNNNKLVTLTTTLSTPPAYTRLKPSFTSSPSAMLTTTVELQPIAPHNNPTANPLHH
jgi:hypothetical protein